MNRVTRFVAIAALLIAVIGIAAFLYLTRPLASASQDVQSSAQVLEVSTEAAEDAAVYRIVQADSSVQFEIDEVLNGADTHVVGTTSEVAGDILINFSTPSASEVGDIRINARTFATDNDRRNAAIGRFILQSEDDANEFITFSTTGISGLPNAITTGETFPFQITGNLTIAGSTQSVTFDASASLSQDDLLTGSATTTVQYSDFGLSIPSVPQVASVSDDVVLSIQFSAARVTDAA